MSSTVNSTFDPYTQNITFLMADGITPVLVSLKDIDDSNWYNSASSINYGVQMGACLVMFFVVAVLTKEHKRQTAIFILNILSLLFGFLRALLFALYFVSPWTLLYPTFGGDYTGFPRSAYATSIVGSVMPLLMTITVDLSLVLQAHTVCHSTSNSLRHTITGLSCLVLLLAVGFRFAVTVTNALAIMSLNSYYSKEWITTGALVTETISIWFFSLIFTGKLAYTLYTRHRNGWKQWSGVRILAAMGGCTMVIPSIFAVLEYVTVHAFPEAGSLALTMVALLLPLSSLWASMAIDQETSTLDLSHLSGPGAVRRGSDQAQMCSSQFTASTTSSTEAGFAKDRQGSFAPISPTSIDSKIERGSSRDSTELDLEAMGVRVDKSYTVQSRKASVAK